MNRKKFLKTASTGVLAASLLPLLSFKKDKVATIDQYITEEQFKVDDFLTTKFAVEFDAQILTAFDTMEDFRKRLTLSATFLTAPSVIYKIISISTKNKGDKNLHYFTCEKSTAGANLDPEKLIEKRFPTNFQLEVEDKIRATLKIAKGKTYKFAFHESKNNDAECFLTSATVFHKGLSDDCKELTTLRKLREKVMKPNLEYAQLISEYQIIAPKMLLNINTAENKDEILESIYNNLVLPSVSLVENGKNIEAIEHYRDFVKEMKVIYL